MKDSTCILGSLLTSLTLRLRFFSSTSSDGVSKQILPISRNPPPPCPILLLKSLNISIAKMNLWQGLIYETHYSSLYSIWQVCPSAISLTFCHMLLFDILTPPSIYWPPLIFTFISESENYGYKKKYQKRPNWIIKKQGRSSSIGA